ncbi:response regulator [Novosphingobium sp. JCM 18896]|uniref:response regulator n=1 Tax=Novosphingobium sp. JCM 18896 TaxID=2989731 RepID=UPI0022214BCF|nr:response regulator [Novosphingobium sp. JCM 18896]MCW1432209.1 response regulator [Novosphingobium sp. JCM 18896]
MSKTLEFRRHKTLGEKQMSVRPTILVVEDDPLVRITVSEMLSDHDFPVITAGSADEGLGVLRHREDIATVITDVIMPGTLDGLGLVSEIRRRWPAKRVIVASGRMPAEAAANAPGTIFLAKPFGEVSLLNAVETALQAHA